MLEVCYLDALWLRLEYLFLPGRLRLRFVDIFGRMPRLPADNLMFLYAYDQVYQWCEAYDPFIICSFYFYMPDGDSDVFSQDSTSAISLRNAKQQDYRFSTYRNVSDQTKLKQLSKISKLIRNMSQSPFNMAVRFSILPHPTPSVLTFLTPFSFDWDWEEGCIFSTMSSRMASIASSMMGYWLKVSSALGITWAYIIFRYSAIMRLYWLMLYCFPDVGLLEQLVRLGENMMFFIMLEQSTALSIQYPSLNSWQQNALSGPSGPFRYLTIRPSLCRLVSKKGGRECAWGNKLYLLNLLDLNEDNGINLASFMTELNNALAYPFISPHFISNSNQILIKINIHPIIFIYPPSHHNIIIYDINTLRWHCEKQVSKYLQLLIRLQKNSIDMQEQSSTEQKCKYTVTPIQCQDHRQKLDKFIKTRGKLKNKTSLCRFYLRGICIMKPEYCKFAHSVSQLELTGSEGAFYMKLTEKEIKRREFTQKKQFNQTALFILKNVKYYVLYNYQFGERYQKSKLPVHDIETISKDRGVRIRIRQIMHRENWDGFIDFIEKKFPNTNYPISFISFWYANFGFDKPQTRCKFGDFLKYAMFVRKYVQIDILFPPNTLPSIFLVNTESKVTILQKNVQLLYNLCMKQKEQESKEKMEEFLQKALPKQLSKKYFCRYFMAGNCQQSSEDCLYAHSIEQLSQNYELGQEFPPEYRQPVMPIEVRMNYTSLYEVTRKFEQYADYSLQDINLNSTIRCELRQKIHHQLFEKFMKLIQAKLEPKNQNKQFRVFSVPLKDLQRYYQGAGFNHTNQNKFQHLESSLWDLGYYMEDLVMKDETTLEKKKYTIVYKIPPIQYLNEKYSEIIRECVQTEIKTLSQNGILLESALKRTVYSFPKEHVLALHVYLRYRGVTFQDVVVEFCKKQEVDRIFFESGQQNIKKMVQIVKKFIKKSKKYITKVDEVQAHIRNDKKQQLNLNHFFNMRNIIQSTILEIGRLVYFWPFDNNAYIIDPTLFNNYKNTVIQPKAKLMDQDQSLEDFKARWQQEEEAGIGEFLGDRIVVVDSWASFRYGRKYLEKCAKLGVDLEGRLRADGYIDLIQISGVKRDSKNAIEHKQIFVFDIWKMKQKHPIQNPLQKMQATQQTQIIQPQIQQKCQQYDEELYIQVVQFLKKILESESKIKILHDCRQDSIALKNILNISLANVFDTSGFDVYINQQSLYEKDKKVSNLEMIRKIYDVKIPGLNTILDTYKAPNGVNIFKESMKKKFGDANSRAYFEQRPLDEEFLEYSARDVEDLIEVWENMIQFDKDLLAGFIGQLYSSC